MTTIGSVTTASTELIAVSVMLSATCPPNRWLYRLAVVPPGEAASSIMPTASSGGRSNASTSPKQTAGSSSIWQTSAIAAAFGCRADPAEVLNRQPEAQAEHDDAERDGQADQGQR